ncbi:MAG: protein-L-isoaspartate(D-aspartate) O-methyltransferase, partial [Deltaproteobacteria bacterium]|nr:protein-L-isoaspartate(D-aspartate) O-methyltransferase [Deltaproteobacteria bacterium]
MFFSHKGGPDWIETQLVRRGITDRRVLEAMAAVDRGDFMPPTLTRMATYDGPLPIGCGQTISQPYVVALSLQGLALTGSEKVLDVGTGSGYQAALLARLAAEVFTVEAHHRLFITAKPALERAAGCPIHTRQGDGSLGWPEEAPFDAIVVGARAPRLPPSLADQLAPHGRLVIPLGGETSQTLYRIQKRADGSLDKLPLEQVV